MSISPNDACAILKSRTRGEMIDKIKALPVESMAELYAISKKMESRSEVESMREKARGTEVLNGDICDETAIYLVTGLKKIAGIDV